MSSRNMQNLFGHTWYELAAWAGIVLGAYLIGHFLAFLFSHINSRLKWLRRILPFGFFVISVYAIGSELQLPRSWSSILDQIFFVVVTLKVCFELHRGLSGIVETFLKKIPNKDPSLSRTLPSLVRLAQVFLWILALILILSELGVDVTSLVTGLGIGGIALALAAQETLSNFIASLSILSDRPFRVGDLIKIQEYTGTVQGIGLRSTRLKTSSQTIVSIPNKVLANTLVENISEREMYKVEQFLELPFSTPKKNLEAFVFGIRKILEKEKSIDPATSRVHFLNFGSLGLQVKVFYYIQGSKELSEILRTQEDINFQIKNLSEKMKIQILSLEPQKNAKPSR